MALPVAFGSHTIEDLRSTLLFSARSIPPAYKLHISMFQKHHAQKCRRH